MLDTTAPSPRPAAWARAGRGIRAAASTTIEEGCVSQDQITGNEPATPSDGPAVHQAPTGIETPDPPAHDPARHFPRTLVAIDPPTLPATDPVPPSAEFRQFPQPQRSVPGHPRARGRLRRALLFWRRGA